MKTLSVICLTLCAVSLCALAQIHNEINPPEKNAEILKIKQFIRYDSEIRPFTKDEIQKFSDYIYDNPITKDIDTHHRVPIKKIDVTEYLYQQTKDEDQKKKLLDLLMAMFTEIQTARDALGIDPLDPEEGYLYFDNSTPEPKKVYKNPGEEMMDGQRKMNAFTARMNEASLKINDLIFIQGYLKWFPCRCQLILSLLMRESGP